MAEALEDEVEMAHVPSLAAIKATIERQALGGVLIEIDALLARDWEMLQEMLSPAGRRDWIFGASLSALSEISALKLLGLGFDLLVGPDEPTALTAHAFRRAFVANELRQAHHVLAVAVEAVPCGVTVADAAQPDFPLIFANEHFARVTGYSEEESLGRNCRFLQGDQRDQTGLDVLRAALREGRPAQVLLHNLRRDGQPFVNELNLVPVRDARGSLTHFVGVQHDLTALESAQSGERRFRGLAQSAPIKIWEMDAALRTEYLNDSWRECFRENSASPLVDVFEWVAPVDVPALRAAMARAVETGRAVSADAGLLSITGERRAHQFRFVPRVGEDGRICGLVGTATDVAEQTAAAENSVKRLRALALQSMLMRRLLAKPPGDQGALAQALDVMAEMVEVGGLVLCPLPNGPETVLAPRLSWPADGTYAPTFSGHRLSTLFPFSAQEISTGRTVVQPSRAELRRFQAAHASIAAMLLFPIRRERVVVGCLIVLGSNEDPAWVAGCRENLESVCHLLQAGCP